MRAYPIFLQDEEMSCGAYCILMILKYHGYQEEVQKIQRSSTFKSKWNFYERNG